MVRLASVINTAMVLESSTMLSILYIYNILSYKVLLVRQAGYIIRIWLGGQGTIGKELRQMMSLLTLAFQHQLV